MCVIRTDPLSMLRNIERHFFPALSGPSYRKGHRYWTWHGPAVQDMRGSEAVRKLAGKASVQGNLRMDKEEIAKATSDRLCIQDEIGPGDNTQIKRISRVGREDIIPNRVVNTHYPQPAWSVTSSVDRHTLQRMLEQKVEHVWECPECWDASLWLRLRMKTYITSYISMKERKIAYKRNC